VWTDNFIIFYTNFIFYSLASSKEDNAMKSIYLPVFEFVNFEDIGSFLGWLGSVPSGRISFIKMQKTAPVRSTKLGPMLRLLEQLAFIVKEKDAVFISASGMRFSLAELAAKKVMIKNQFLITSPMWNLLNHLETSNTGRLTKNEVFGILKSESTIQITEKMTLGIMAWGHCCELFYFDETSQEISRILVGHPSPGGNNSGVLQKAA
jgi:hypothetical protein